MAERCAADCVAATFTVALGEGQAAWRQSRCGCQMIHDMRPSAETRGHLAPRPSPQTLRLPLLISSSAPCSAPHLHRACNYENSHA